MGHMKDFDRRIRQGGDDAIAAVSEYVATLEDKAAAMSEKWLAVEMELRTKKRWIPVSERLPEKGVPVIGWFHGATQSFECSLNEHDGVWCDYGTGIYLYENERPTHWMPFPEGPPEVK